MLACVSLTQCVVLVLLMLQCWHPDTTVLEATKEIAVDKNLTVRAVKELLSTLCNGAVSADNMVLGMCGAGCSCVVPLYVMCVAWVSPCPTFPHQEAYVHAEAALETTYGDLGAVYACFPAIPDSVHACLPRRAV